jgi:hypothetical protein
MHFGIGAQAPLKHTPARSLSERCAGPVREAIAAAALSKDRRRGIGRHPDCCGEPIEQQLFGSF